MDKDAKKVAVEWRGYHEAAFASIDNFRKSKLFIDVTIVIGDAHLPAHRVVLSACSSYFQNTLAKVSNCAHPLIAIQHPKVHIMELLLDYMYRGKVNVDGESVSDFISSAKDLGIHLNFPGNPQSSHTLPNESITGPKAGESALHRNNARKETETSHDSSISDFVSERSLPSSPSPGSSVSLNSPLPSNLGEHKRAKFQKEARTSKLAESGRDQRGSQRFATSSHGLDAGSQLPGGEDLYCSSKSSPLAPQQCLPFASGRQAYPWFQLQNSLLKQGPQPLLTREPIPEELLSPMASTLSQHDPLNNPALIAQSYLEQLQTYGSWIASNFLGSGHSIFSPITSGQLPTSGIDNNKAPSQPYWPEYDQGDMSCQDDQAKKAATENEKLRGRRTKYHRNDSREKVGFPCSLCSKVLSDHSSLYRHQKAHKGEKPHECAHCGKKFSQKYNMIQHMKIHFRENPRPVRLEPEVRVVDPSAEQEIMIKN